MANSSREAIPDTSYERYLLFDKAIDPRLATPRDRFETFARSVRDVLAHRWVLTKSRCRL